MATGSWSSIPPGFGWRLTRKCSCGRRPSSYPISRSHTSHVRTRTSSAGWKVPVLRQAMIIFVLCVAAHRRIAPGNAAWSDVDRNRLVAALATATVVATTTASATTTLTILSLVHLEGTAVEVGAVQRLRGAGGIRI